MPKPRGDLTHKQAAFVEHYLEDWNATNAARKAGYQGTYESLRTIGSQNLTKPKIKAAIEERMAELSMPAQEVLYRITAIARAGLTSSKIRTADALRALELLGKHFALFTDRLEIHDWRKEAEARGLSPGELFEQMVNEIAREVDAD